MFSFLAYYPYRKLSKGGSIMTKIQALSALLAGTVLFSSTGCSLGKNKEKKQEIQKFTGLYCARNDTTLDEDNEIRNIIAEKTGYILYEEWMKDQADVDKIFSDMMISRKYPDFMSPDGPNCQRLIKEGAFIPLDNYWDKYPNLKSLYSDADLRNFPKYSCIPREYP